MQDATQGTQLEVARATVLGVVHERSQGREHPLVVGALAPVSGQQLGELGSDQVGRVEAQHIARAPVGGLDPAVRPDQHHPIGGGVEDLGEAGLLELDLLVVAGVVHRDGGVGGQAREELHLLLRELVGLEKVSHEHAEHVVAHHDGNGEKGARGGLHQAGRARGVSQRGIGQTIGRAHGPALLEGAPRYALARLQDQITRQGGVQVKPAPEAEPAPGVVQHVDPRSVAAEETDRLLHDLVEHGVHVERGGQMRGHLVQLGRLLLASLTLRVETVLVNGHRRVVAESGQERDVLRAEPAALLAEDEQAADGLPADLERHAQEPWKPSSIAPAL